MTTLRPNSGIFNLPCPGTRLHHYNSENVPYKSTTHTVVEMQEIARLGHKSHLLVKNKIIIFIK